MMRTLKVLLLLLCSHVASCGVQSPRQIMGTVTPSSEGQRLIGFRQGQDCAKVYQEGSYTNLGVGNEVKVKNNKGEIISIGRISGGTAQPLQGALFCVMNFQVSNIPSSNFYSIGKSSEISFSRPNVLNGAQEEIEKKNWKLDLVL